MEQAGASKEGTLNGDVDRSLFAKPLPEKDNIVYNLGKIGEIGTARATYCIRHCHQDIELDVVFLQQGNALHHSIKGGLAALVDARGVMDLPRFGHQVHDPDSRGRARVRLIVVGHERPHPGYVTGL